MALDNNNKNHKTSEALLVKVTKKKVTPCCSVPSKDDIPRTILCVNNTSVLEGGKQNDDNIHGDQKTTKRKKKTNLPAFDDDDMEVPAFVSETLNLVKRKAKQQKIIRRKIEMLITNNNDHNQQQQSSDVSNNRKNLIHATAATMIETPHAEQGKNGKGFAVADLVAKETQGNSANQQDVKSGNMKEGVCLAGTAIVVAPQQQPGYLPNEILELIHRLLERDAKIRRDLITFISRLLQMTLQQHDRVMILQEILEEEQGDHRTADVRQLLHALKGAHGHDKNQHDNSEEEGDEEEEEEEEEDDDDDTDDHNNQDDDQVTPSSNENGQDDDNDIGDDRIVAVDCGDKGEPEEVCTRRSRTSGSCLRLEQEDCEQQRPEMKKLDQDQTSATQTTVQEEEHDEGDEHDENDGDDKNHTTRSVAFPGSNSGCSSHTVSLMNAMRFL